MDTADQATDAAEQPAGGATDASNDVVTPPAVDSGSAAVQAPAKKAPAKKAPAKKAPAKKAPAQ